MKPWEKYSTDSGPWEKYQTKKPEETTPEQPSSESGGVSMSDLITGKRPEPSLMSKVGSAVKSAVTGEGRMDPNIPELGEYEYITSVSPEVSDYARAATATGTPWNRIQSARTPQGAINILRKTHPDAQLDFDEYGNPLILFDRSIGDREAGQPFYLNKPGMSWSDIDYAQGVLKRGLPAVAMSGTAAPLGVGKAMLMAGAGGAFGEAQGQLESELAGAKEGYSIPDILKSGAYAAAGEGIGRGLVAGIGAGVNLFRRMAGKPTAAVDEFFTPDGRFTDKAINLMKKNELDPSDLEPMIRREMSKLKITPEQAQRYNQFLEAGVKNPTKAQLTQSADDFQMQQEFIKRSGPMREAIESQDKAMVGQVEDLITGTGKQSTSKYDTGNTVADYVLSRRETADKAISELYKQAEKQARTAGSIKQTGGINLDKIARHVKLNMGKDRVSDGVYSAIQTDLRRFGIVDSAGKPTGKVINAKTAEQLRQSMNQLHNPSNAGFGNKVVRNVKEMIDDSVFKSAGDDFYKTARATKMHMERGMRPEKISRYDKRSKSLVLDLLEGKLQPDDVVKNVMSSSTKSKELKHLKTFMLETDEGAKAFGNLRGDILEEGLKQATMGKGESTAIFNGGRFQKFLFSLGDEKLKVIFTPEEYKSLLNLSGVGQLRIPVQGTALGQGPTAQAVRNEIVSRVPWIGKITDVAKSLREAGKVKEAIKPISGAQKMFEKIRANQGKIRTPIPQIGAGASGYR